MERLTAKFLASRGACSNRLEEFKGNFGLAPKITEANVEQAFSIWGRGIVTLYVLKLQLGARLDQPLPLPWGTWPQDDRGYTPSEIVSILKGLPND